jgi:hypothetical protein
MTVTTFPNGTQLTSSALTQNQFNVALQSIVCQMLGINPGILETVTLTPGSNVISVPDPSSLAVGQSVAGMGIPSGTVILSINGNTVTLSNSVTAVSANSNAGYGQGGYGVGQYGSQTSTPVTLAFGADSQAFYRVRVGWQIEGQPAWNITDDICAIMATIADDSYNRIRDVQFAANDETTLLQTTQYTRVWQARLVLYGPNSFDNARLIKSCLFLDWVTDALANSNLYLITDVADPTRSPEEFEGQWWERSDITFHLNENVVETITVQSVASVEVIGISNDSGQAFDITIKS